MISKIVSVIRDFGLIWSFNRAIYIIKLRFLNIFPKLDFMFEKKVSIKNIDIFDDIEVKQIEEFLSTLSETEKKNILSLANDAIEGKIMAFSSIKLDYGLPINWHLNPITGNVHSKNKKWFQIPDFDDNVGDIKTIWEISRFTHFLYFSRAYLLTKDLKYYYAFEQQLSDWLDKNMYSFGPNYKCGQEATIRMTNLLISYSVFNSFGLVDELTKEKIRSISEGSYKKVLSNFFYAHKCIKNNHTFTEILGRIMGGLMSNDEKELNYSMNLMDKEIRNQFTNDGGFRQYSANYHRFTLQVLEVLFKLEHKIGIEVKEKKKILESTKLLFNMMNSEGIVPNYGSNDGAHIFPLASTGYRDFRPTINTIFAQLTDEKLLEDGTYSEELLWFYKKTNKIANIIKTPINANEIGIYSFNHKESMAVIYLNDYKTRPAHMDQLHFELWYKNIEIFCDLGTYSYASKLGRDLTLNKYHNTISIDEKPLMNRFGAFTVYDWSQKMQSNYVINSRFKGSLSSKNGYTHEREVLATSFGYELRDSVSSAFLEYNVHFHTPLDVKVIGNEIYLSKNNKDLVKLVTHGKIYIERVPRSIFYLKKDCINRIDIGISDIKSSIEVHLLKGDTND